MGKYNDGSQKIIGFMLIVMDMFVIASAVVCIVAATYIMRTKLRKYDSEKVKMRLLLRTASHVSRELNTWATGKKSSEGLKNWTVPEDRKEDNKKIIKTNKKQTKVIPINDKPEESLDYVPFPNGGSTKITTSNTQIDASSSSVTHKNQLKEIKLQYGPRSIEYKAALQQVGLHRKASLRL